MEAHSKLASGNVNESIEPNVQASHEVVSSSAVFPQAQIDPISEVANRPSSIILQPPHPARSVSTPIFTHMGQQVRVFYNLIIVIRKVSLAVNYITSYEHISELNKIFKMFNYYFQGLVMY